MSESFAELFEKSLDNIELKVGSIVNAKVTEVGKDFVVVNAGLKSEGFIPVSEFTKASGECSVEIGDEVEVALEAVENGFGETKLSHEKAKRIKTWKKLEGFLESQETIMGHINVRIKGGFSVDVDGIQAFLPGSLVDVRPIKDTSFLEGTESELKVVSLDEKRNNIVVSRRAVIESEYQVEREQLLSTLKEGDVLKGIVKNLTDYGAFVDLGGLDGLLHITDISWKRIKYPSEVINIGDEFDVKILSFDKEKGRVSLGLKQLKEDPWSDLSRRIQEGNRIFGKVSNITDYGCFVEIEEGIEGLVHVSEMDWTNKNVNHKKLVSIGQEVEVMVLDINEKSRRISLGMKQCLPNPWTEFTENYKKDDVIEGKIRSITDFGIFIGLDGNIDGLVHVSDLSWTKSEKDAIREYSKGDEVKAIVLAIDSDKERISLGIKQLDNDPFASFLTKSSRGNSVTGKVSEVTKAVATIDLGDDIFGKLRVNDYSKDRIDDLSTVLNVGDEITAQVTNIDKKTRFISLSVIAKEISDEKQVIKDYMRSDNKPTSTSLGDIFNELKEED